MIDQYEKRLVYVKNDKGFSDIPDYKKINEFIVSVNRRIVMEKII